MHCNDCRERLPENEDIIKKSVKDQEAVIHLAALPFIPDSYYYPADFFKINAIGSVNMLWHSIKSKSVEVFLHLSIPSYHLVERLKSRVR